MPSVPSLLRARMGVSFFPHPIRTSLVFLLKLLKLGTLGTLRTISYNRLIYIYFLMCLVLCLVVPSLFFRFLMPIIGYYVRGRL